MSDKKTVRAGRPANDTNKQAKLIEAARELFVANDYEKVSTRKIAALAGVDASLIRYYFGSKIQLFIAMIKETTAPVFSRIQTLNSLSDAPAQILRTYYQVMAENPDFPKLIFRLGNIDLSKEKNKELWKLLTDAIHPRKVDFFDELKAAGVLKDDISSECAKMSFISLMVFPFLMPDNYKKINNIKLTDSFLTQLAEHNIQMLSLALLKTQDENNDKK